MVIIHLNVELFIVLYIFHKIADYLFQTDGQARFKSEDCGYLIRHCVVYTVTVLGGAYLFLGYFNWAAFFLVFFSHLVIDKRDFLIWWAKHVKGIEQPDHPSTSNVMLELDQALHYIILFIICL